MRSMINADKILECSKRDDEKNWTIMWYNDIEKLLVRSEIKPKVFFINGVSGSGKTTLINNLIRLKAEFLNVEDFDEGFDGKEKQEQWRRRRMEQLIDSAIINEKIGKITLVIGSYLIEEVKNTRNFKYLRNVSYGLLNIDDIELTKRLRMKGYEENVIESNKMLAKRMLQDIREEENTFIVESRNNLPDETLCKVVDWILNSVI
ncbi:P-loop NTPase fold protein [Clostridium cellulovorans]|uniref:Uncharacterized protein n=1 Tax=Clostridium cellulovorans (strain ATCC 35296 / DSM 3052 / OCM 3 / 743B) TaxID=573061 RepID=D9SQ51_CLOC7|nr:P-loop NTPase fold protein [Clostridium cellulovorans]ADL52187.1 hypothetical protein Clocel_2474 [Clostridium cellulovorans 743B]